MKILPLVTFFLKALSVFSQTEENTKANAVLLVHTDYYDFFTPANKYYLDSIIATYSVSTLEKEGILETTFFSIKQKCNGCDSCIFILAYNNQEKRFFRLQGFKYNEFNDFYNLVLLSGSSVPNIKVKSEKKTLSQIEEQVKIDGINIRELYRRYYKKYKNCLFDDTSCYRKSIFRLYKKNNRH